MPTPTRGGSPGHVAAAVDDAREEFADRPGADLRTGVQPAFYRRVAGFHCAYRGSRRPRRAGHSP